MLHLQVILLAALGVYTYRDIYPLATFTHRPVDIEEDWILWVKITLLLVTSIFVPLFIPRTYVPVDEKVCCSIIDHKFTALRFAQIVSEPQSCT